MINIKGMLEVEKLCAEYLGAHLLDSMSGEYSQDDQHVLLQLKIDLTPEQFMLADPLSVHPRVLLLVSLGGAVLSLFAPSTGISCWNSPAARWLWEDDRKGPHVHWPKQLPVCREQVLISEMLAAHKSCCLTRLGEGSCINTGSEWAQGHPLVAHCRRTAVGIHTVPSLKMPALKKHFASTGSQRWMREVKGYIPAPIPVFTNMCTV